MTTVLFLAANPRSTTRLGLDEEIREIRDKLRGSVHQQAIDLRSFWAARPDDLLQALNELRPDVLHFSGHGDPNGELTFVDGRGRPKPVSERALTATLRAAGERIRLVVLNACYSYPQAKAVVEVVPCAIGMNAAIGDRAAIVFAAEKSAAFDLTCRFFSPNRLVAETPPIRLQIWCPRE
ncbi:CHAT domain-containing protein [Plantactinospora sp. B5E13]|uniref:CHAT domain-containing protein n=1 Tax=unclassified Plantactinospora TaxID=2631981 RepID=UPI00325ED84D